MIIKKIYSPNHSKKSRNNKEIKLIVIHYTGMQSKIASIKRLLNSRFKVSCHYLIDRKGQIIRMVDENKTAWHAGKSKWKTFSNLNKNSIGIELVNKGHSFGYETFPNSQINQLIKLCLYLKKKYRIKSSNIVGHSDIAPLRKKDPGEKFPWKKLQQKKIGFWYKNFKLKAQVLDVRDIEKIFFINLSKIGYKYYSKKKRGKKDLLVVKAFQRRFLPKNVTGIIDKKTFKISHFLAESIKN